MVKDNCKENTAQFLLPINLIVHVLWL